MTVDAKTVRRVALLSHLAMDDAEIIKLEKEINNILHFVESLSSVNVDGVEALTSVVPTQLPRRPDRVTDGGVPEKVLANAPMKEDGYFLVPKVVE